MTPQPSLLPVFPPLPRSSSPACMTTLRPSIDSGPLREIRESEITTNELLVTSAIMLPKLLTRLLGSLPLSDPTVKSTIARLTTWSATKYRPSINSYMLVQH